MRRARNLAVFGLAAALIVGGLGYAFREPILGRLFGVSFDAGAGGEAS